VRQTSISKISFQTKNILIFNIYVYQNMENFQNGKKMPGGGVGFELILDFLEF